METRHVYVVTTEDHPSGHDDLRPSAGEQYRLERTEVWFTGSFTDMVAVHKHYVRLFQPCLDRGPRVGEDSTWCVKERGHDGRHRAHESWSWNAENVPEW